MLQRLTGSLGNCMLNSSCRKHAAISRTLSPDQLIHAVFVADATARFLHDQSHFAVAQRKYVFIYDRDGVELHCLKAHIEPTCLEFLPYHWLLATIVSSHAVIALYLFNSNVRVTLAISNTKIHQPVNY